VSSSPGPDAATWVGIAVAGVIGLGGWIMAGIANSRSKKANTHSEQANTIATGAVIKAESANRIAEDANKLSKDANALVELSVLQQTEDWFVEWVAEWNVAGALLILTQRGRDDALQSSVVIAGKNVHKIYRADHPVSPGQDLAIEVMQVLGERNKYDIQFAQRMEKNETSPVRVIPEPFSLELTITIHWFTGGGFVQVQTIELKVT
jgi:hypothetical protein